MHKYPRFRSPTKQEVIHISLPSSISSLVGFSMTMADDSEHRIVEFDLPFYELNIHVYTENAKYGPLGVCDGTINAGDVVFLKNGNLRDFIFKNASAGSNTKIVAIATVPNEYVKEMLR